MQVEEYEEFFHSNIDGYEEEFRNYIWKKTYDEDAVGEILQNAFLRAWNKLDTLREPQKAKSWMYKIIDNCIKEYWRQEATRKRRVQERDVEEIFTDVAGDSDPVMREMIENFQYELIIEALGRLTDYEQSLMIMRYVNEMGIKTMVEITGLKEKTLSSKLSRTVKKCREIYFMLESGERRK